MSALQLPSFANYPRHRLHRFLLRLPILEYRLGLGPLVGRLVMVMSHTGRKSAQVRRTAILYHSFNGRVYVLNGYGQRSDWYRNMLADPRMTLQTAQGIQHVRGRRVTDEQELLALFENLQHSPALRVVTRLVGMPLSRESLLAYREQFDVVSFEPTDEPTPPALPADLRWIWPLLAAALLVKWLQRQLLLRLFAQLRATRSQRLATQAQA